jgi:hypothetical protein
MIHYRFYFHDQAGHILRAEDADLETDEAALAEARMRNHAFCVEVWQRTRKVGIVHPQQAEA